MRHVCSIMFVFVLTVLAVSAAQAAVDARLLRFPDVSETQITFVYAGDIWVVPKQGGQAHRLSTPLGEEAFPRFSPDGQSIAFSGNYDGNGDVYVVPTAGGVPVRLTHHPMPDRVLGWYPDGEAVLFASSRESGKQRFSQFYRLDVEGGLPQKLPVPYGEFGMIAEDGKSLAYMPLTRDFRVDNERGLVHTWKRYRGGMTTDIWLFNLEQHTARNITDFDANDGQPMWHGTTLYFQSDRDAAKRNNIWAYETTSGELRQITRFTDYDVRFPAIGPSDIVFENGGRLYLLDLDSERHREVDVEVVTDRATLKPRMQNVSRQLTGGDISPSGKRAVLQARGEIFTLPAKHGFVRNLTRTSGFAERTPAWSPDGKEIAYFSDKTGEYELTVRPADGSGEEQTLTSMGPGFRYEPFWSPDSKKLAFIDQAMKIWYYDREADKLTEIDQAKFMMHGGLSGFGVSWSADSRWIAYHNDLDTRQRAIFLHDISNGERHQVTSGFYDDASPVFDPDGKYLYFRSGRNWRPVYSDIDTTWVYINSTQIVAVPLRNDVSSPLAARNDEEEAKKEDEEEENGDVDAEEKKDEEKKPESVDIDIEGFERRLVVLPADPGNYGGLAAVSGKVIYHRRPRTGSGEESSPIVFYDLEEREEKTILDDADGYSVSADGKKMLVVKNTTLAIVDVAPKQKMENTLATGEMAMELDPAAEWRQIFNDAWRLERDYFYDPNLHGVDWDEMRTRYGKLIDDAVTRWDVNFVIGELIGELNASHSFRGDGDQERGARQGVGLLGCDFALENGAYKIAKIIDGAAWDNEVRSPLTESGLDVKEGDYLLAVNGVPLDTSKDPWAAFQGLAEKTVLLTVNGKPELEGAREVLVETLNNETRLRNLAWIEQKRKYVEEKTGGRVGYIYVPSTGRDGQTELRRMFQPQYTKDGLIIDERFNNGGQIPARFVEMLNRPLYNYWAVRDGADWQWPPTSHIGPKVMLINQWSGSGGDCFPFYFKEAGLGPLIGTRTWGGLIGISGAPGLIDGGVVTVPTFSIYSVDGEWIVEGYGVDPDIEVVDDPSLMVDGGDPQLDRAIAETMRLLRQNPPRHPDRPTYTDRSGQ